MSSPDLSHPSLNRHPHQAFPSSHIPVDLNSVINHRGPMKRNPECYINPRYWTTDVPLSLWEAQGISIQREDWIHLCSLVCVCGFCPQKWAKSARFSFGDTGKKLDHFNSSHKSNPKTQITGCSVFTVKRKTEPLQKVLQYINIHPAISEYDQYDYLDVEYL